MPEGFVALLGRLGGLVAVSVWIVGTAPPCLRRPRPAGARRSQAERVAAAAFGASLLASLGLAVVYATGGQPQLEGLLLFVVLGGIGAGIVAVGEAVPARTARSASRAGRIASTPEERGRLRPGLRGGRRGASPAGASSPSSPAQPSPRSASPPLFPIRSLGPRPGAGLKETPWRKGSRAVNEAGRADRGLRAGRRRRHHRVPGGPHRTPPTPRRCSSTSGQARTSPTPGREDYAAGDLVAYSKLCTHLGCPVGLYQAQASLLLCPCHQSTFDVPPGVPPGLRPGDPLAAAAADRRGRDGLRRGPGRLQRSGRPRLLGSGPVVSDVDWRRLAKRRACKLTRLVPRLADWVDDRARRGQGRPHGPRQDLPGPLVVHARRAGPLLLLHPRGHRRVPDVLLQGQPAARSSTTARYGPLHGVEMSTAYESAIRLSFDVRAGIVMRQAHHWAALIFLATIFAHLLPRVLHRRVPPAAGDQLDHRPHDADPGDDQRLLRLLAARRPALGLGPAHRLRRRPVDPGDRHVDRLAVLRRRVPGRRPARALLRAPHPHRAGRPSAS